MERTLVIGDVHGCLRELEGLLRLVDYGPSDRLVLLGDLMDRGPDGPGCVRLARQLDADCVKGNHEDLHLRYRKHEAKRLAQPGYKNPMRALTPKELHENAALSDEDIAWMSELPIVIDLGHNWLAVHAGFEPLKPFDKQRPDKMIRVRYVDPADGDMVSLVDSLEQPEGTRFWTEMWTRPENVVYGHTVHSLTEPRIDRQGDAGVCAGIDTGCCFHGALTCFVLPDGHFVQVKAYRRYAMWRVQSEER